MRRDFELGRGDAPSICPVEEVERERVCCYDHADADAVVVVRSVALISKRRLARAPHFAFRISMRGSALHSPPTPLRVSWGRSSDGRTNERTIGRKWTNGRADVVLLVLMDLLCYLIMQALLCIRSSQNHEMILFYSFLYKIMFVSLRIHEL